ncbi:MAG: VCBS repeat-containing protein [Pseudomonadota bacterium]
MNKAFAALLLAMPASAGAGFGLNSLRRRARGSAAAGLAALLCSALTQAGEAWKGPQLIGSRSTGIVGTGDFNRDGAVDVAYSRNGAFQWYAGPDLSEQSPEHDIGEGSGRSYGGTAVDINGDGWPDLVAADGARSSGPGRLWAFLHPGTAAGATSPWDRREIWSLDVWHQNDLAVADLDLDGRLDVVVRTRSDDLRLVIGLQNANFDTWTSRFWPTGETSNTPEGLAVGDVDSDGVPEIVLSGVYWDAPDGWRGGDPQEHMIDPEFVGRAVKSVVADLDGDGADDDVAMVTAEGSQRVYLAVYVHDGNPRGGASAWRREILLDDVTNYHTLAAADFNQDGRTDLLAGAAFGSSGISVFYGGAEGFTEEVVDASGKMYVTSVADLNNDGAPDFVGPRVWQDRVVAYLSPPGTPQRVFADGFE